MQLGPGLIFVSVLLIGSMLAIVDADTNVRIMTIALVATLGTGIVGGYKWHTGGATFAVFASGAVATMPGVWISLVQILVATSSVALFSVLLKTALGLLHIRSWTTTFRPTHPPVFQADWSLQSRYA